MTPRLPEIAQDLLTRSRKPRVLPRTVNLNIAGICRQQEDEAAAAIRYSQSRAHRAIILLLVIVTLAIAVGVVFSLWMMRVISQPLQEVVRVLKRAATGDLRERPSISGKDEFGVMARELDTALSGIARTVSEVSQTAKGILGKSREPQSSFLHPRASS